MVDLKIVEVDDRLLSVAEAAAYLGVKPNTVHNWSMSRNRKLSACKVGRLNKYRLSGLNAFIQRNTLLPVDAIALQVSR